MAPSASMILATSPLALEQSTSLSALHAAFASLEAPSDAQLRGRFCARFVGPLWLRWSAGPSIALAGLRGFWGKDLAGFGEARNVLVRRGELVPGPSMELARTDSSRDGRPCAVLRYGTSSPFPWPYVVDELRLVQDGTLLGMTIIQAPLLRRLAFPFLLVRSDP